MLSRFHKFGQFGLYKICGVADRYGLKRDRFIEETADPLIFCDHGLKEGTYAGDDKAHTFDAFLLCMRYHAPN